MPGLTHRACRAAAAPALAALLLAVTACGDGRKKVYPVRGLIRVDGKPQHNWSEVFKALGLKFEHHIPYSTIAGVVISGNDKIEQLAFPTADGVRLTNASGIVTGLLEIRILRGVASYQVRNPFGELYQIFPDFFMPRSVGIYGIRWEFSN